MSKLMKRNETELRNIKKTSGELQHEMHTISVCRQN